MAAYCWVYGVIHFTSSAGWLPVHRDQLWAQRSVTSMGKLYLYYARSSDAKVSDYSAIQICLLLLFVVICARRNLVESYCGKWQLTATIIIISFPSPTLSFIPDLKPFFLQILPTAAFLFLLQDWLHDSPDFYCYIWACPFILFLFPTF